ncbi:nucleoporin nup53 [Plakobranchus ocellatus]|uniref:Nucleoporin NUP53 n=1 Tax=Plakobranchus ocellatus TaxID=259542 RepID=A0AAV4E2N6_9GAST|nr:nucleoporin nup53 [Plakobranchus ocellatus]
MYSPGAHSESFHLQGHDSHMSMSPGSPVHHHQLQPAVPHGHSSPFLPGYLLGDHPSHHVVSSPRLWSSGSGASPAYKPGSHTGQMTPSGTSMLSRKESLRTKPGGPPTKSLFSSPSSPEGNVSQLNTSIHNRSMSTSALKHVSSTPATPSTGFLGTPGPSRGDLSLQALNQSQMLPVSPAQADPFYTQGDLKSDDVLDETWVTVFGFPPGATSFILQQFSQYGTILKHVVASECNWMHIHYLTKMQAKKALSKDGKVYGGCMKIGVTACIEKTIMEEKENQVMYSSIVSDDQRRLTQDTSKGSLTPIRPLTAAYVASRGEYEVLKDKQTPKRDTSLMTKLKDYMFGY